VLCSTGGLVGVFPGMTVVSLRISLPRMDLPQMLWRGATLFTWGNINISHATLKVARRLLPASFRPTGVHAKIVALYQIGFTACFG
jgi:hypothetical protein